MEYKQKTESVMAQVILTYSKLSLWGTLLAGTHLLYC